MHEHTRPTALLGLSSAILLTLAALVLPNPALAAETQPTLTEAQCAIVTDAAGNVLWSKNPDQEMAMASITKVMTAMVALDSGKDLDAKCTITASDLGADSQTIGFTTSDTPTLRELIRAMLVYSGNDAALNVAINVAGSEDAFVDLMNEKAQELGMAHTHFANPHGLEADGHYSCVADLAVMGRYAHQHYPLIASTVHTRSVTVSVGGLPRTYYSTDELMSSYRGLLGIKTGTVASGAAFLGDSMRGSVELYTCVLGCATSAGRFADTAAMMDWAYQTFSRAKVSDPAWVTDVRPYALNFACSVVVRPEADLSVASWPDFGGLDYTTTAIHDWFLVDDGQQVGTTSWSQRGRTAGTTRYVAHLVLGTVPRVGILSLPLWWNGQGELGGPLTREAA